MKSFLASCAVLLLVAPGIASAERIKVAIVPGLAVNVDAARVDVIGQELAEALASELDVEAVGGLEVRRQLPAEGLPPDCITIPSCVADVAQRLGVSQLLFVVMIDSGSGGSLQIDSTWLEPATGRSASRPAIDLATLADARPRFVAAARQLLPDAPVRPKPSGIGGTMSPAVPRHFTPTTWITAAVGVVGLGVGIGFGLRTRGLYADCDQTTAPCGSAQQDRIRNSALIADLGFLAAIGGAVATAVLYTTSGSESRLIVAPSVEPGGAGVSLTALGRF